jgi:hypothetical protein
MSAQLELYEQLAEVAEHELELAAGRRLDELAHLSGLRARLVDRLPATPPRGARAALERCRVLQERVGEELLAARAELLAALADVERAQRAARGYRPPTARRPGIQLDA